LPQNQVLNDPLQVAPATAIKTETPAFAAQVGLPLKTRRSLGNDTLQCW
jgi:hypothetical protein